MAMLMQISGMTVALFSAGLAVSGVRELAEAKSASEDRLRDVTHTLRIMCQVLGWLGTLALVLLANPIAHWSFGTTVYQWDVIIVAFTIVFGMLGTFHSLVLQAYGMIKEVAALNVLGVVIGAVATISSLVLWGAKGIAPALAGGVAAQWMAAAWFARSAPRPLGDTPARFDSTAMRRMLGLGVFAAGIGLLSSWAMYPIRTLLVHETAMEGAGLYQAASTLSSQFAMFVLAAMGTDFFPRLSGVIEDKPAFNRMLNEQTEVALQLGIPGVIATIAYAPLLIPVLNTQAYLPASPVLQLLAIGVFGRLLSWPLSFALMARKEVSLSLAGEIAQHVTHIGAVWFLLPKMGVLGAGLASILVYLVYSSVLYVFVAKHTGFRWSRGVWTSLLVGVVLMLCTLGVAWHSPSPWLWVWSGILLCVGAAYSIRGIAKSANVTQGGVVRRIRSLLRRERASAQ
jgi:enterobacterial common antigen flippase